MHKNCVVLRGVVTQLQDCLQVGDLPLDHPVMVVNMRKCDAMQLRS